jgi:hypothetical protein
MPEDLNAGPEPVYSVPVDKRYFKLNTLHEFGPKILWISVGQKVGGLELCGPPYPHVLLCSSTTFLQF